MNLNIFKCILHKKIKGVNLLKLFEKKKDFSTEKLDVPPAPPPMYEPIPAPNELPAEPAPLPELPKFEMPEAPNLSQSLNPPNIPEKKKFSFFKKKTPALQQPLPPIEESMPPNLQEPVLPPIEGIDIPNIKQSTPPQIGAPTFPEFPQAPVEQNFPEFPQAPDLPQMPQEPIVQQPIPQPPVAPKIKSKEKFLRIENFRRIIDNVKGIKNTVKLVVGMPIEIEQEEKQLNKNFESWKASMKDIQKQLSFIDKILFEGD